MRMKQIWTGVAVVMMAIGAETSVAADPQADAAKRAKARAEATTKLNGTWAVELMPMFGDKKQPKPDTLSFDQGKVSSSTLGKDGYSVTNATISVGDDGVPVWETMQTSEGKGVAFWRGELHGETMTGVLSKHPVEGSTEDYSFSGKKTGETASMPATPASTSGQSVSTSVSTTVAPPAVTPPAPVESAPIPAPEAAAPAEPATPVVVEPAQPAQQQIVAPASPATPAAPSKPEPKKKKGWF
jgi:hypothetical protein